MRNAEEWRSLKAVINGYKGDDCPYFHNIVWRSTDNKDYLIRVKTLQNEIFFIFVYHGMEILGIKKVEYGEEMEMNFYGNGLNLICSIEYKQQLKDW